MMYRMEAWLQGSYGEPYRWEEWDYYFSAASSEEAAEKAFLIKDAFNEHGSDWVKWADGPYSVRRDYVEFLLWCKEHGMEFPCTTGQFYARAKEFAQGDYEIIDILCTQGIGPDWADE